MEVDGHICTTFVDSRLCQRYWECLAYVSQAIQLGFLGYTSPRADFDPDCQEMRLHGYIVDTVTLISPVKQQHNEAKDTWSCFL